MAITLINWHLHRSRIEMRSWIALPPFGKLNLNTRNFKLVEVMKKKTKNLRKRKKIKKRRNSQIKIKKSKKTMETAMKTKEIKLRRNKMLLRI